MFWNVFFKGAIYLEFIVADYYGIQFCNINNTHFTPPPPLPPSLHP